MQKLVLRLENCYGIKKLEHTFDFSTKKVFSVYAPNGTMKTSFAKTLKDFCSSSESNDLIFKNRTTIREIKDESNNEMNPAQIFVIEPYIKSYRSDKLSTLLVNKTLKLQYEEILKSIEQEKTVLFAKLKQLSGLTGRGTPIEDELSKMFPNKPFFDILLDIESTINGSTEHPFSSIIYNKIFEEKIIAFLNTKDFKKQIKDYIERYNDLISSSKYLQKGFNHSNASEIQKNLKANGFFKAKHSVNLFNGTSNDLISDEDQLQDIISKEMTNILKDDELQKKFNEINDKLSTIQLKEFREYLSDNQYILPELANLEKFQKDIWYSYFTEHKDLFNNLLSAYKKGKTEIETIIQQAKKEETDWKEVIDIFNERFSVPFRLEIKNQDDVILKSESPNLNFIFTDNELSEEKNIEESDLLKVLSQWELRALYILNIIFEVKARIKANQETVFIVDDIADSFDYKNKYAIIEYLKEILEVWIFYQIILTHNFDFHRTVSSRLDMGRWNKLNTIRTMTDIQLVPEKYQNNPFSHWKDNLHQNNAMLLASIPFVRNLAEYIWYEGQFKKLTSLLHFKGDTNAIKISELENIIKSILVDKTSLSLANPDKLVLDLIYETADEILNNTDEIIELENKIVLAIAIRLKAEKYMTVKINDDPFCNWITENQSFVLIKRYKTDFPTEIANIKLLEEVNLMTPENIHLNSFMYEPILDMSNQHLKQLYSKITSI